jgi:hypothetical protein
MATLLPEPPWEYLCQASKPSLQGFELSRLNHATLIREQISALLDEWIEENSAALLARWLLNQSERLRRGTTSAPPRHPARDLFATPAPELPAPPNAHPAVAVLAPPLPTQPSTPTSAHAADPLPDTIRGPTRKTLAAPQLAAPFDGPNRVGRPARAPHQTPRCSNHREPRYSRPCRPP